MYCTTNWENSHTRGVVTLKSKLMFVGTIIALIKLFERPLGMVLKGWEWTRDSTLLISIAAPAQIVRDFRSRRRLSKASCTTGTNDVCETVSLHFFEASKRRDVKAHFGGHTSSDCVVRNIEDFFATTVS